MKQKWKFLFRDKNGWLGFRCIEGPGSIFSDDWVGDLFIDPEAYWAGNISDSRVLPSWLDTKLERD
jgi:hypothetical protein